MFTKKADKLTTLSKKTNKSTTLKKQQSYEIKSRTSHSNSAKDFRYTQVKLYCPLANTLLEKNKIQKLLFSIMITEKIRFLSLKTNCICKM